MTVAKPWPLASTVCALLLIGFGLSWEMVLDPLRPGGSWLALKVLPLALALRGLYLARPYTFKWMSLMVWFYVGEALVRIAGPTDLERALAWISLFLSLALTLCILAGARDFQRALKASARADDSH